MADSRRTLRSGSRPLADLQPSASGPSQPKASDTALTSLEPSSGSLVAHEDEDDGPLSLLSPRMVAAAKGKGKETATSRIVQQDSSAMPPATSNSTISTPSNPSQGSGGGSPGDSPFEHSPGDADRAAEAALHNIPAQQAGASVPQAGSGSGLAPGSSLGMNLIRARDSNSEAPVANLNGKYALADFLCDIKCSHALHSSAASHGSAPYGPTQSTSGSFAE